jgi:hypothetical protein
MLPILEDDLGGAVSLKRDNIPKGDSVLEGDNVLAGDSVLAGNNVLEGDNVKGDNILEGENIERLHSAVVDLHCAIPVCPWEPSLYRFSEQLQDQVYQDNDDNVDHISCNKSAAEEAEEKDNSSGAADGDNEDDDDSYTVIKSVITIKVYDLPSDVSFPLHMMVPP